MKSKTELDKEFPLVEVEENNFELFGNDVIVKVHYFPEEIKSEAGLILSINLNPEKTKFFTATIIAKGNSVTIPGLDVGRKVLVKAFSGQKVYYYDDQQYMDSENDYVKFNEKDIIGFISEEKIDIKPIKNFVKIDRTKIPSSNIIL